jgi:hypothetical protein
MNVTISASDETLACLAGLAASAGDLHAKVKEFTQGTRGVGQRSLAYDRMFPLETRLALVEEISRDVRALARDGYHFRRLEARALYAEGLTMAQLATVFGVSRQRVSALLRDDRADLEPDLKAESANGAQPSADGAEPDGLWM